MCSNITTTSFQRVCGKILVATKSAMSTSTLCSIIIMGQSCLVFKIRPRDVLRTDWRSRASHKALKAGQQCIRQGKSLPYLVCLLSAEEQVEQSWRNSLWNLFAGDDVNKEVVGLDKCIGDDTKAAARRSPKCSRKNKKTAKNDFQYGGSSPSWILGD